MSGADVRASTGSIPVPQVPDKGGSLWSAPYLWVSIGSLALVFLGAMQALSVTTVMPLIVADLHGESLYALAFSGTLAAAVIGMVVVGAWCDRTGPALPLCVAAGFFIGGVVIGAVAASMPMFVGGRLVMGLGSGGLMVALYVAVARAYPPHLQGRMVGAMAAAWVIPSLIGPALAGAIAQYLHWRWVFVIVAGVGFVAIALIAPRLRGLHAEDPSSRPKGTALRIGMSVVVAIAALGLNLSAELDGLLAVVAAIGSLVLVTVAILPLLPRGTVRLGVGLPSVVVMRGLIAGALFGAEIYLPRILIEEYGFSATLAGLGLTAAAILWSVGAEVSGRIADRVGNRRIALSGVALLALAQIACGISAWLHLDAWVSILFWGAAGLGMGLMYPRQTVLTIAYSTPSNQGFNTSSLQICDSVGAASAIAVMGLVFTAISASGWGYVAVFAIGLLLALAALVPGLRLGHAREER